MGERRCEHRVYAGKTEGMKILRRLDVRGRIILKCFAKK
jgi:hypothetical protein